MGKTRTTCAVHGQKRDFLGEGKDKSRLIMLLKKSHDVVQMVVGKIAFIV